MFGLFESSSQSGRPVGLYEFRWGEDVWRYTSADREVEWGTDDDDEPLAWTPAAISDNGVTQGPQPENFEVDLPANLPIVALFRATPPSESVWLTVRRYHFDDPDAEANVIWIGTVGNIKRKNRGLATAIGLPISGTMRRSGLRLCWEIGCPHMLYDEGCRVNKLDFMTATVVTDLTATEMTVDDIGIYAGEQYAGGFIEFEASLAGTIERRTIEGYLGANKFLMFGTTDRLADGVVVKMFLGCDLTPATCDGTFNNLSNHGGYAFLSKKSPFDGKPIF